VVPELACVAIESMLRSNVHNIDRSLVRVVAGAQRRTSALAANKEEICGVEDAFGKLEGLLTVMRPWGDPTRSLPASMGKAGRNVWRGIVAGPFVA